MTAHFIQTEVLRTKIPKIKYLCAKESLKHNSLLSFRIPPRRNVVLYFYSFSKGMISFYSVILIGLVRITSKNNKKKVALTCLFREDFRPVCCLLSY